MHNKFLPLFVALIFMQAIAVAQTCIKITKPADTITMPCTQNCTGFTIKVPGLHANTGYNVQSTTYNPNPFINSGTAVGFLDGEDGFSDSITLPFPFALYDSAYDKVVIAVDGFITFNKAVAKTSSIFNGLGYPSLPNNFLTEASIVAIKEDLWLTAPTAISTTRVDTITLGTAPCRKFVISWNNVPQYFCTNNLVTAQIVLYEGSNIVETYIKTRPVCAGSEGNNSFIMGMQNWARNLAVIPPGRAQSTIAINNEAWQYTPNGAAFLFQESDLYLNNQLLGPGDTTRINQDTMSVFFDEICPDVGESQNLKIYTKYLLATNSPQQFILTDSIVIRKLTCNPLVFTSVNTDPTCFGSTNGSIVIHASGGTSPYTFSINGTSYFTDSTFSNLAAGTYTLYVKDATNTIVTSQATLTAPPQLTGSTSITNLACPFSSSGSITVTAGGGTPPYQYSLDGGSFQSSNIFSGLIAGGHTIIIKDAHNCTLQLSATVTQPPAFVYSSSATIPSCFGGSNGTVTINVTGGTPPYLFSLNSGPFQSSNVFTGLPAGTYLSQIKDANNCLITGPSAVLGQPTAINGTTTVVNLLCAGASTGSITVSATGGVGGYQYSLTGVGYQISNVFNGLTAGTYSVWIKDANGCTFTLQNVIITQPPALTATRVFANVLCFGGNTGSITVTAGGGTPAYQYSVNGGSYQASNVFSNLVAGTYSVTVRDNNNCTFTIGEITISQPAALLATASTQGGGCGTSSTGRITVTASGGSPAYQYALNGGAYQSSNVFNNLAGGSYNVSVKDANNCTFSFFVEVQGTFNPTVSTINDASICAGSSIVLTTVSNAASFSWSPSAGLNNSSIQSPTASPTTNTQYIVTATLGPCTAKDTVNITVSPSPTVNAGPDLTLIAGEEADIQATASAGTYLWTPATGLNSTTTVLTRAKPSVTTTYTLKVTNDAGCSATDDVLIVVMPDCFKPMNAFTPNGDGINDKWLVTAGQGCARALDVTVFNRNGAVVFHDANYLNTWDGTYGGKGLPDATYYYVIKVEYITGRYYLAKGNVTILR